MLSVVCKVLLVDGLSLGSVLVREEDSLMVCVVPCKRVTGLTVGLGIGERLSSKNPVLGL